MTIINGYDPNDPVVKTRQFIAEFERWRPQIDEALHHGRASHTSAQVFQMILANRVFFYSYPDCFLILEKVVYPEFCNWHCFLAGGNIDALIAAQGPMEKIALELGCQYLSIAGRPGWVRALKNHGWEPVCYTMYKEVSDERRQDEQPRAEDQATERNRESGEEKPRPC